MGQTIMPVPIHTGGGGASISYHEALAALITINIVCLPVIVIYTIKWFKEKKSPFFNDTLFDYFMDKSFGVFIALGTFLLINGAALFFLIGNIVHAIIT